jgi:hypothetical protein
MLLTSPAAAQSAAPPPDAPTTPKAAAQESYARGNRLFNQAEQRHDRALYEAAYLQFSQAFAIFPDDRILWNLLVVEMKTDRFVDGLRHLHTYEKRKGADPRRHSPEFTAVLDQALRSTARIAIEAPAGVPVRVDGTDVGMAPFVDPVDVAPGVHKLEATLINGKTLVARTSPAAGELAHVTLAEAPSDAAPPPAVVPPLPLAPLSPQASPADGASTSWWTPARTIGVGAAVVAAVGIGGGIGFHFASTGNANQANSLRASVPPNSCATATLSAACTNVENKINAANQDATLSTVSFVVGGVAAAASLGLIVFGGGKPAARTGSVEWTPVVGLGSVGIAGDF